MRHPSADPQRITAALGMEPRRAWKAGEARQTPVGTPLQGTWPATYWYVDLLAGRHPEAELHAGINQILDHLGRYRDFFHAIRAEGGSAELFIGWFFERQSGDMLRYETLAKAGDLRMDLSFDVYPPTQPQNEYEIGLHDLAT